MRGWVELKCDKMYEIREEHVRARAVCPINQGDKVPKCAKLENIWVLSYTTLSARIVNLVISDGERTRL